MALGIVQALAWLWGEKEDRGRRDKLRVVLEAGCTWILEDKKSWISLNCMILTVLVEGQ